DNVFFLPPHGVVRVAANPDADLPSLAVRLLVGRIVPDQVPLAELKQYLRIPLRRLLWRFKICRPPAGALRQLPDRSFISLPRPGPIEDDLFSDLRVRPAPFRGIVAGYSRVSALELD